MSMRRDRRAAVLNKLKSVVEHSDSAIAAGRRLAIERWTETYIGMVEYLKDDRLQFLYDIFCDEECWSGTRFDNAILGQRLTVEKCGEMKNPFCIYNVACRYCVVELIYPLFEEEFETYKSHMTPDAVDIDGNPVDDKYIRNDLLDSMSSYDPAYGFWIDRESGELKLREIGGVEGFREAAYLKWSEGVEYFYNHLDEEERKEEITNAVISLSAIQTRCNRASVLDFCMRKMDDSTKRELLVKLSEKDEGVYSLLNGLIKWKFLDTVEDIVYLWCYEETSVSSDKMISHRNYNLLFSVLSDVILENPDSASQAKKIMMDFWRCGRFNDHKKAGVDFSNNIFPKFPMKRMLAGLIVDWKRDDDEASSIVKKNEILEILQFAKSVCSDGNFMELKKRIVDTLRIVGRPGMKYGIDYGEVAESFFDEIINSP